MDFGDFGADLGGDLGDDLDLGGGPPAKAKAKPAPAEDDDMDFGDLGGDLGDDLDLGGGPPAKAKAAPAEVDDMDFGDLGGDLDEPPAAKPKRSGGVEKLPLEDMDAQYGLAPEKPAPYQDDDGFGDDDQEDELAFAPGRVGKKSKLEEDLPDEDDEDMARVEEEEEAIAMMRKAPSGPRRRGGGLMWGLVVLSMLLTSVAAVFYFRPDWVSAGLAKVGIGESQDPGPKDDALGAKLISPEDIKHFFVKNGAEGQLLVITGLVVNHYPQPRGFIRLKGLLNDDTGKVMAQRQVFAGNVISEEDLGKLPLGEINRLLVVRGGQNSQNTRVEPGQGVPFMFVFNNLPPKLANYTVEVYSSETTAPKP
jgi:hypothetical protein